jgi:hypothetical protein
MHTDIKRKIIWAKYVLARASSMQSESTDMSVSLSLLLMHDAAELLMVAVLDFLGIKFQRKREFMDFWTEIKPTPPDRFPMQSLNNLRISFKHHGVSPNTDEVRNLLPRVEGFFENVLKSYCDIDYAQVSLVDLIPSDEVKAIIGTATRKFLDGDKDGAMIDLQVALHKLQEPEGKYLPRVQAPKAPHLPSEMEGAGWSNYFRQLHTFLQQTATITNALMFGIDPIRYLDFIQMGPSLQWAMNGKYQAQLFRSYNKMTQRKVDDLVSFLIDYALKISGAYIARMTYPPAFIVPAPLGEPE